MALDDQRYLDLAVNLALWVRRLETRPISVVVNQGIQVGPAHRGLFDHIIELPADPSIRGAMNKARLFEFTPYERTMYVDADCIFLTRALSFSGASSKAKALPSTGTSKVPARCSHAP